MAEQPLHLALVGLMGAGKTSVARELGGRLGRRVVDLDREIEALAGRSVAEIFAEEGEEAFRDLELTVLERALGAERPSVIATGGGVITSAAARALLVERAQVVWLQISPTTAATRVESGSSRPLLNGRDAAAALEELAREREAGYREVADLRVDAGIGTPREVAIAVTEALGAVK